MASAVPGRASLAAPATPYVGRRRVPAAKTKPARTRSLVGVGIPATTAAALSLVATGVGVAAGVDGAALAQGQTETDGSAALALASVRDVSAAPADVANAIAERREQAVQQASRNAVRIQLAQAAAVKEAAAHRWVLPVVRYVKTSGFGMRWGKLHAGEDFAAPVGTPVHAISSGVIVFAAEASGYGNKVEIRHWDGTCSWYGHLSEIDVKVGEKVDPGELIGRVGSTGHSTGPHLHLEIHPHGNGPVDPLPWLRARGLKP
ncbi:MAG: M23 family metallopeptidase [Actinomycetota bacterium]|nr:M23 family metallopeptidase [Actinomycetota bacterium]